MKEWPEDKKEVSFEELVEPVVDAIKQYYKLIPKHKKIQSISWNGYNIGDEEKSKCFNPEERLNVRNLKEYKEEPLNVIIGIGILTGMEQGRRLFFNKMKDKKEAVLMYLELIEKQIQSI